jgi:hypothetical protein
MLLAEPSLITILTPQNEVELAGTHNRIPGVAGPRFHRR